MYSYPISPSFKKDFNFFKKILCEHNHISSFFKQLITCYLQLHFTPKSPQSHTKVRAKLCFSYVSPMVLVTFEYLIYEEIITIRNFWHDFSCRHFRTTFFWWMIGAEPLPVIGDITNDLTTDMVYYTTTTLKAAPFHHLCSCGNGMKVLNAYLPVLAYLY